MQLQDPSDSIGHMVKDVYGREIGRCIGYSVDLAGNLASIGVESGSSFVEYPADCVLEAAEEVVVMPEWKMDAKKFGLEKGVLEKRLNALDTMLKRGEISHKVYDEMVKSLQDVREGHERLGEMLVKRLQELERTDDILNTFLARVKLQGVSEEISETAVKWTSDYCVAMKSMNDSERIDITNALDMVGRETTPLEEVHSEERSTAVPSAVMAEAQVPTEEAPQSEDEVAVGSLRSLNTS